ncbi:MAG: DUF998 domain-containing protein [Thermoplasmata archaeon]
MTTVYNKHDIYRCMSIFGMIGPVLAITLILTNIMVSPWFSWSRNALSDLGVNRYGYLFNSAIILEGLFNIFFVLSLKLLKIRNFTAYALIISGISLLLVGVFNEDHPPFHLIFALIYFVLFPISIIIFSLYLRKVQSLLSYTGLAVSVISLIDIIIGIGFVFHYVRIVGVGLSVPEFIEAVLLGSWSVMMSAYVFFKIR